LNAGDAGFVRLEYNLVTLSDDELIGGSIAILINHVAYSEILCHNTD
jgi:hypothetical protein